MQGMLEWLDKVTGYFGKWLNAVAGAGLVVMLALVIADVIGIKIFSSPIPGAIELVALLGVVVTAFAIAYTYYLRGHIKVEFFVMRLPVRAAAIINAIVLILSIGLMGFLAWRSFAFAQVLLRSGEVSMTQGIPFYPFVYAIAICCLPVLLMLLAELIKSVLMVFRK